jgi:hypothetical protein
MRKEENKFIPFNLSKRISQDKDEIIEESNSQNEDSINAMDFVYFELENEWLQEYELIYNSYKLEN